jgi:cell division septum initiation protein DivIVA
MQEVGHAPLEVPATESGDAVASALAAEVSRRVAAILESVESEAARVRDEARAEAAGYLDDARRRADALVAERQRRIAVLCDELVAGAEAVVARLEDAGPVRAGFEDLVRALGDAAERLGDEAGGSVPSGAPELSGIAER